MRSQMQLHRQLLLWKLMSAHRAPAGKSFRILRAIICTRYQEVRFFTPKQQETLRGQQDQSLKNLSVK